MTTITVNSQKIEANEVFSILDRNVWCRVYKSGENYYQEIPHMGRFASTTNLEYLKPMIYSTLSRVKSFWSTLSEDAKNALVIRHINGSYVTRY